MFRSIIDFDSYIIWNCNVFILVVIWNIFYSRIWNFRSNYRNWLLYDELIILIGLVV